MPESPGTPISDRGPGDADETVGVGKGLAATVVWIMFMVYWIGTAAALPYFNWTYAQTHGFWSWFFFGEVVASAQSFAWPYYALTDDSGEEGGMTNLPEGLRAYFQMSQQIHSVDELVREPTSSQRDGDRELVLSLLKQAKDDSERVDAEILNEIYAGWGDRFVADIKPAVQCLNKGVANRNRADLARARGHFANWRRWMTQERLSEIVERTEERFKVELPRRASDRGGRAAPGR